MAIINFDFKNRPGHSLMGLVGFVLVAVGTITLSGGCLLVGIILFFVWALTE